MDILVYIGTAFGLMFVIEGFLYAVFPDTMRRMMAQIMILHDKQLKAFGIGMILAGVTLVYLINLLL
jgi:uncharacterized protein YjeT (DUF2065 family)